MIKKYIRLFRVRHYVKNLLVFAAAGCSGKIFESEKFLPSISGFVIFCMISSAVYIFNDIHDIEKDRLHPVKCKRPLASGEISQKFAVIVANVLLILAIIINFFTLGINSLILLMVYFFINIAYSKGLKNIPILDVMLLVSGFFLRVLYGALITNTEISHWLYLCVMAMAFYLALGKRRNELRINNNSREVLKFYPESFLDKNMYVCLALVNVFYSLWSVDERTLFNNYNSQYFIFTVPVVFLITMKYSLDVEKNSDGDPAEVFFSDRILMLLCIIYLAVMFLILYL